jgi:hypothetical protein
LLSLGFENCPAHRNRLETAEKIGEVSACDLFQNSRFALVQAKTFDRFDELAAANGLLAAFWYG